MKQKKFILLLSLVTCASLCTAMQANAKTAKEKPEVMQQYIVRYGTTYDYGSTIITEDGNEWALIDAPEYEDGTEVRVLFDSNKTKIVTDDIIIDVTVK